MTTTKIKSRYRAAALFSGEFPSLKGALEAAVKSATNLWGANLRDANLRGANLRDANLEGAKIYHDLTIRALLTVDPIDGWSVLFWSTSAGFRVQVECHFFSLEQAEAYWRGKPDRTHLYALVTEGWKTLAELAGWSEGY